MTTDIGRDPSGQALAVPVEPVARLDPPGFDPSRVDWDALVNYTRELESRAGPLLAWGHKSNVPRGDDYKPLTRLIGFTISTADFMAYPNSLPLDALSALQELARVAPKLLAIAMEASGRDGETRLDPKDDSAGRRHRTGDRS